MYSDLEDVELRNENSSSKRGRYKRRGGHQKEKESNMKRPCPICGLDLVTRREVKTCGSPDCVLSWRTMSPTQKAAALERAANAAEVAETFSSKVPSQSLSRLSDQQLNEEFKSTLDNIFKEQTKTKEDKSKTEPEKEGGDENNS